uniref:Uncharacterized protein n=1 Tax=Ditylenchus dipsaci TaxID=166011 RepID=A0A915EIQ1_9BILA
MMMSGAEARDFDYILPCRAKNARKSKLKIVDRSVRNLVGHLKQHEEYKQKFEKLEGISSEAVAIDRFIVRPSGLVLSSTVEYEARDLSEHEWELLGN